MSDVVNIYAYTFMREMKRTQKKRQQLQFALHLMFCVQIFMRPDTFYTHFSLSISMQGTHVLDHRFLWINYFYVFYTHLISLYIVCVIRIVYILHFLCEKKRQKK